MSAFQFNADFFLLKEAWYFLLIAGLLRLAFLLAIPLRNQSTIKV